jgi:type IV pilus assembly protein PilQ
LSVGVLLLGLVWVGGALAAIKITSIDFKATGEGSVLELTGDAPFSVEKQENESDKQVVLEIKDSELAKGAERKLDTSSFDSPVTLISPYKVEGQESSRVVIQLREMSSPSVSQDGNKVRITFAGAGAAASSGSGSGAGDATGGVDAIPGDTTASGAEAGGAPSGSSEGTESASADSGSSSHVLSPQEKQLENFIEAKNTKRFHGKAITIQVRDADLVDVFRLISDTSGFNIVVSDEVQGRITLSLTDVPWDQVLDVVLSSRQLGAERNGNVLRITTLQALTIEKSNELIARRAAEAGAPRITRVFPISYANPNELAPILRAVSLPRTLPGEPPPGPNDNNNIQIDVRTNSLIVQDLPETVDKVKKVIQILDTQTPQVLIEAKVVEASETFTKAMTGSLGLGGQGNNQFVASFAGGNPIDPLIGNPGVFDDGDAVGAVTRQGGAIGISPRLTFLPGVQRLNALLNIGETESQIRVVAAPKTVVLNKTPSTILQGTPVLIQTATFQNGVPIPVTTQQSADLNLTVTPTVTNDGNLLLALNLTRNIPFAIDNVNSGIANRSIQTTVVAESGSTLVIGGIYTMTTNHTSNGFPILRKIPILGLLFGGETDRTDRNELFFFITPRILNEKEAGLSG